MNRRAFLAMLAAGAVDPERLIWTPGRKLISIPKVQLVHYDVEHVIAQALRLVGVLQVDGVPRVTELAFLRPMLQRIDAQTPATSPRFTRLREELLTYDLAIEVAPQYLDDPSLALRELKLRRYRPILRALM